MKNIWVSFDVEEQKCQVFFDADCIYEEPMVGEDDYARVESAITKAMAEIDFRVRMDKIKQENKKDFVKFKEATRCLGAKKRKKLGKLY
jgi:hypothetical protein